MTSEVMIRRATRADAGAIYELVVELARARGALHKVASTVADIERDGFGPAPAFEALLAERRGEPLGLCLFFDSYSTWRGRRGIYVLDLVVAEKARGLGVGRRLLAETAAIARARGGAYLRLSVETDNTAAQVFYERSGFRSSQSERIRQLDDDNFASLANSAKGLEP